NHNGFGGGGGGGSFGANGTLVLSETKPNQADVDSANPAAAAPQVTMKAKSVDADGADSSSLFANYRSNYQIAANTATAPGARVGSGVNVESLGDVPGYALNSRPADAEAEAITLGGKSDTRGKDVPVPSPA